MERKSIIINGQIYLYGTVGAPGDVFDDTPYFTDHDVALALAEIGPRPVTARINSGGGSAFIGMAIYSLLKAHPAKVTTVVDSVAASAASLIFMAGGVRDMRAGSMLMIHDPASVTAGPAAKHAETAANLNKLADNYAEIYAQAGGKEVKVVRDMMLATTWFTADEAVAAGFATAKVDTAADPVACFDYRLYAHAPAAMMAIVQDKLRLIAAGNAAAKAAGANAAQARMRMRQAAAT